MNISRRMLEQRRIDPSVYTRKNLKLDIGCGDAQTRQKDGYIGIDIYDFGQEIVWDIEDGIPFADNSVSKIYTEHVLEHINDLPKVLNEFHRILKPEGEMHVIVPHVEHKGAYAPTHCRFFNEFSFEYLNRVAKLPRYGLKGWEIGRMVVNRHNDLHVTNMKPIKNAN